jgi:hypothetical protein
MQGAPISTELLEELRGTPRHLAIDGGCTTEILWGDAPKHQTPVWGDLVFSACGNAGNHVPTDRVVVGFIS